MKSANNWKLKDRKLKKKLDEEIEILKEKEQRVNVLEKHKEHKKEEYLYEEKMAELKTLNEVGSQKHFMRQREQKEEQENEEKYDEYQ